MVDSKLHPALTVTNIKSLIPITLEMEKSQYTSWSELFKIHCRAYQVLDHIIKLTESPSAPTGSWSRINTIVLQWIYNTISNDLFNTIHKPNTTTFQAWDRLAGIFKDKKDSRALYLNDSLPPLTSILYQTYRLIVNN